MSMAQTTGGNTTTSVQPEQSANEQPTQAVAGEDSLGGEGYTRGADYPMDITSYLMGILFLSTGLISLLGGYKYKWMTLFLAGFYTAGLVLVLFIIKFQNVTDPTTSVRLVYLLVCVVSGLVTGGFFVCMFPTGRLLVGFIGGLSLSMIILATDTDLLIHTKLWRYILIGSLASLFVLPSAFKKTYPFMSIISTICSGCYLIMLGVDIFVRGGLLAGFKYAWGFTEPDDYRYVVERNTFLILIIVGVAGGAVGLAFQMVWYWIAQNDWKGINFSFIKRYVKLRGKGAEKSSVPDQVPMVNFGLKLEGRAASRWGEGTRWDSV
ncbi:10142_t:CDS:2 [Paraglomus occultum]|uniref:10142_t:CDS:1 n=1 Tax=Paraglomus occultum TaxID=144539 RepID=A0A9N9FF43_9GLOM|nr:10142_t:CDS:2 [Paraglomus occultum]